MGASRETAKAVQSSGKGIIPLRKRASIRDHEKSKKKSSFYGGGGGRGGDDLSGKKVSSGRKARSFEQVDMRGKIYRGL